MSDDRTVSISFAKKDESLKQEYRRRLAEAKKKNPKASRGEVAKAMMREGIQAARKPAQQVGFNATTAENQLAELTAKTTALFELLRSVDGRSQKLRDDVASVTTILLTQAGKMPAEHAIQWIQDNLKETSKG